MVIIRPDSRMGIAARLRTKLIYGYTFRHSIAIWRNLLLAVLVIFLAFLLIFLSSVLKPGSARSRKIWPPRPNYRPVPARPGREPNHTALERRLWNDEHRRQCYQFACQGAILLKIHVQVCGFSRYLLWKFKTFMWHIDYNTCQLCVAHFDLFRSSVWQRKIECLDLYTYVYISVYLCPVRFMDNSPTDQLADN